MEKAPKTPEKGQEEYNPNSIGELISIGRDLPTSPEKVYRSVRTKEAIDDIESSGVVRNKQAAGLVEQSRWGDRVFWSKGAEGKFHSVSAGGYVIEAPLAVAKERVVTKEDVSAIYTKNEKDEVVDILREERAVAAKQNQDAVSEKESHDAEKLRQLKNKLGLDT